VSQSELGKDPLLEAAFPIIAVPQIPPTRTAMLIVDMTKGQADPHYGLGAQARAKGLEQEFRGYYERIEAMISNILKLREVIRALGGEAIYLRSVTQTSQLKELDDVYRAVGHCPGICPVDSTEAEFLDELQPSERDIVIAKLSLSPFNSTALDQILRNLGIEALIITGVRTDEAVELTAHGAADRGYWVSVVSDGCTAASEDSHDAILRRLDVGLVRVKSAEEVLKTLLHREWKHCP
jgi:nicotinamidase-related amidase